MPKKPSEPHPGTATPTATELARLAAHAGAVRTLVNQLATINVPVDRVEKAILKRTAHNDIAKANQAATDIAKAVSRFGVSSDLPQSYTVARVNLKLPDTTRMIQASLPRVLADAYPRPQDESPGVVSEPTPAQRTGLPISELPSIEIKSPDELGLLIRKARERRNQSQQSFADLAGVGRRFVSELENGKATLELGKVLKVMRAAGISIFARNPT
ncbi:helix-turn-helix transcriptional regulator [Aquibium sp. ELW1220]|uniref:helix-turn-helix transcriptional regulator n=1 Tax=Aquibium sp. ELW1220 TaxID=2976766 RepID=UPI0025AFD958|nr:helix-turn-helix transcriptional regulator [Aquibium sp. ELW1220]MDN2583217.1 helix-turn-helix transcriptional regulator [Aquibium sp. ELW1220]